MRLNLGNRMVIPRNGLLNIAPCVDEVARKAWNIHVFFVAVNVVASGIEDNLRFVAERMNVSKPFIRFWEVIPHHAADLERKAEVFQGSLNPRTPVTNVDEVIYEFHVECDVFYDE